MSKALSKPKIFWSPSAELSRNLDDADTAAAIAAAQFRFAASMRDLEQHFDEAACKLRSAFVKEVQEHAGSGESEL